MSDGSTHQKRIEELETALRCVQTDRDSLRTILRTTVDEKARLLNQLRACELTNQALLEKSITLAHEVEQLESTVRAMG
ncbi:MAG: hypothetical protein ACWA5R_03830 [bacterium]